MTEGYARRTSSNACCNIVCSVVVLYQTYPPASGLVSLSAQYTAIKGTFIGSCLGIKAEYSSSGVICPLLLTWNGLKMLMHCNHCKYGSVLSV